MQAEETVDAGTQRLRHHLAIAIVGKAIDHHPIEAGERPHLARTIAQEGGHAVRLRQPRDHRADHGTGLHLVEHGRLCLDHHQLAGEMDGHVEGRTALHQRQREDPLHRIGATQQGDAIAQRVDRIGREDRADRLAQHLVRRQADMVGAVGRDARHQPVGRQGDKKAERLDRAKHMDRLAITIIDVDGKALGFRAGHISHRRPPVRRARRLRTG